MSLPSPTERNLWTARRLSSAHPHLWRETQRGVWEYKRGDKWYGCVDNDPFSDLNALHEMEKVLDQEQANIVSRLIGEAPPAPGNWSDVHMWHADVKTRAEALKAALSPLIEVSLESVIVDVAYIAGQQHFHSGDSRADAETMIKWAKEFHAAIASNNWAVSATNYIEAVEIFTKHKLAEVGT